MNANERTFTEHTQALNEILQRFQQSELSLETSISLFEEGLEHSKKAQAILNREKGRFLTLQEALQETNNA